MTLIELLVHILSCKRLLHKRSLKILLLLIIHIIEVLQNLVGKKNSKLGTLKVTLMI